MLVTEAEKCRFTVTMTLDEHKAFEHYMAMSGCDLSQVVYIMCCRGFNSIVAGMKSTHPLTNLDT